MTWSWGKIYMRKQSHNSLYSCVKYQLILLFARKSQRVCVSIIHNSRDKKLLRFCFLLPRKRVSDKDNWVMQFKLDSVTNFYDRCILKHIEKRTSRRGYRKSTPHGEVP